MRLKGVYLLCCLFILGCSTTTEYKQASTNLFSAKHGFKITPLESDIYEIRYLGRKNDSHQNIDRLTLRAASELTLDKGFIYFEVIFDQRSHKDNIYHSGAYNSSAPISITTTVQTAPMRLVQIRLSNTSDNNKQHAQRTLDTLIENNKE